jgi:outer membrane protein OmpA-like peptidoglycan-associated protein
MKNIFCLLFCLSLTLAVLPVLFAQEAALPAQSTAQEIETLLETRAVTYAQAARFVLEAADAMVTSSHEEAFRFAAEQNWLPKNARPDDLAQLNHISRLLMLSFETKGGVMYTITKNSRYAYRELKYLNVIQSRSDPAMFVSGERLLFYVNRILTMQDAQDAARNAPARITRREAERTARREALAAEIAVIIEEQKIADTTVEATNEGVMITLSNIMFQADSVELPAAEMVKIREIARVLRSISGVRLLVAGHATHVGTEEYRLTLSRGRAQSVADYLVLLDAAEEENVSVVGYGSSRPVADTSTPEGMAANRRVEITILEN